MATFKAPDKMPAQGGFLIIRPSMEDYKGLINTLMTTEFVIYHGWNHSQIGWFWGGMTVQGILPYYYNRITTPGRSLKIDRCVYNTMADVPECIEKKLDQVKSAHFTVCQKPWNCERGYYNPLCGELHREWFRLRYEAEKFYSLPPVEKACPKGGPKFYIPMDLSNAVVPTQNDIEGAFVPDVSPDLLLPAGNSGFIHNDYETIKREYTAFEFLK